MFKLAKKLVGRHRLSPSWKFWDKSYININVENTGNSKCFITITYRNYKTKYWYSIYISEIPNQPYLLALDKFKLYTGYCWSNLAHIKPTNEEELDFLVEKVRKELKRISKKEFIDKNDYVYMPMIEGKILQKRY